MKRLLLISTFVLSAFLTTAQQNDLRITYYANQGVSGLAGANKVYMYSGAATSAPSGTWEWIIGSPNLDDGIGEMTSMGNDTWYICIEPHDYYSQGIGGPIPVGTPVLTISMYFRNEDGTLVGFDTNNFVIVLDLTTSPVTSTFTGVVPGSCAVGNIEIAGADNFISNYPNPLESTTTISYYVKNPASKVSIHVYDVIGQKVTTLTDGNHTKGQHKINWNGESKNGEKLKNGLYFYTYEVNGKVLKTNRIVVSR